MPDPIFPEIITKEQIKLGVDVRPNTAAPIQPYTGPKGPTATGKPFIRTVPVQAVPSDLVLPTDNISTGIKSITRVPSQTITDSIERSAARRVGGSLLRGIGGKILGGAGIIYDVIGNAKPTVSGAQEAEAIRQAEALRQQQQQQDTLPSLPLIPSLPAPTTPEYNPFDIRPRPNGNTTIQPSDRVVDSPSFPIGNPLGGINLNTPILEELLRLNERITQLEQRVIEVPVVIAPMIQEVVTFTGGGFVTTIDTITKIQTNTYIEVPKSTSTVVAVPVTGGGGIISVPVIGGNFFSVPSSPETIVSVPKDNGSFIAIPKDCQEIVSVPQNCNQFVAVPIIAPTGIEECCDEIKKKFDELFPRIEGSGEIACGTDEDGNPIVTPYQYSNYGLLGLRDQIELNLQVVKNVLTKVCDLQIEYPLIEGQLNYDCQTGIDESNNPIIETTEQEYTGTGFLGLQDQINKLAEINKAILSEVCQFQHEPNCFPILPDARYEHQKITDQLNITFGEEYPTQNGSLWHISIPNPIEGLDWCTHFDSLTLHAGSKYSAVYGRILWADTDMATSAWFASQEAAEMFLSYCLSLTTATPKNPANPIRITLNGSSNRTREEPFVIRAVRAVESHFNPDSFEPELIRCYAPPRGGCSGT